nr:hypothetical protein [Tanacetum cinerariifolium]
GFHVVARAAFEAAVQQLVAAIQKHPVQGLFGAVLQGLAVAGLVAGAEAVAGVAVEVLVEEEVVAKLGVVLQGLVSTEAGAAAGVGIAQEELREAGREGIGYVAQRHKLARVGLVEIHPRKAAHAVVGQKLTRIKHSEQQALEAVAAQQTQQARGALARLLPLQRNAHHIERKHGDPRRAIGLLQVAAKRQRGRAVKHPDVIKAQEATLEDVAPVAVLTVHPPRKIEQQAVKHGLQKVEVAGI